MAAMWEQFQRAVQLVAEVDGAPVGFVALLLHQAAIQSCYVHPNAARQGVGSALIAEIERIAVEGGITALHVAASVNAEAFYASLGYTKVEDGEHVLSSGQRLRAVTMVKLLRSE